MTAAWFHGFGQNINGVRFGVYSYPPGLHYLFGDEIIQNGASIFSHEVKLQLSPERKKMYRWAHTFQAIGSVNSLNKAETPSSDSNDTFSSGDSCC